MAIMNVYICTHITTHFGGGVCMYNNKKFHIPYLNTTYDAIECCDVCSIKVKNIL